MSLLRTAVTGFLGVKMATLLINCARFPVLVPGPSPDLAGVSVLVPARDEADRLPATLPGLLAQGSGELLVLDDGSTDGTGQVAADLIAASGHPRARVLTGHALPPGWTGKTWACHQLAEHACGSTLVFLDADVSLHPGALAALLAEQRRAGADVFSVFPHQVTRTLGEHLLVPAIDQVVLTLLAHPLLALPVPAAATAHGACLVLDRDAYDRVGGFAAVRGEIVDDVALARRTRALGLRLGLALGGDLVRVRMYASYGQVVAGLSRGLLFMTGGSRPALVLGWVVHLLAYTLPVTRVAADRRWWLPLALGLAERALVEVKTRRYAVWQVVLVPAVAPAFGPMILRALRGRHTWRGRTYP